MALARSLALAVVGLSLVPAATFTAEGARVRQPLPVGTELLRELPYAGPDAPRLDAYVQRDALEPRPALLVIHGGSWMSGDKRSMERVATAAAARGLAVFNVNYTLARPGSPGFPQQFAELRRAVRWIRARAERLNVDPDRIGALGTSAGGHLAALLATAGHGPLDSGARIGAAVTWSAPTELGNLRGWLALAARNFVGCLWEACDRRADAASPVSHVTPHDPPMLIFNSRHEVVPASQGRALAHRLGRAGVGGRLQLLPGDMHGREYADRVLDDSLRFLVSRLTS
jgi:acetyl esterase